MYIGAPPAKKVKEKPRKRLRVEEAGDEEVPTSLKDTSLKTPIVQNEAAKQASATATVPDPRRSVKNPQARWEFCIWTLDERDIYFEPRNLDIQSVLP